MRTAALLRSIVLCLTLSSLAWTASAEAARTVKITANETLHYSVNRIRASPGETLQIVLTAVGDMDKTKMAHNFVLLAPGVDPETFVMEAALARTTGHLPTRQPERMLASTSLAGGGETVTVTFDAPKEPGQYTYLCTFPGHFAGGMRGVLVVR